MKPSKIITENYYTVGIIVTVLTLYSASVYNYFSEPESNIPHADVTEVLPDVSEDTRTLRVLDTQGKQLFRPIDSRTVFEVPGTNCTLTSSNLSPDGTLSDVPSGCEFTQEEER